MNYKTDVAIIGAGPAGLMLGHALRQAGIGCIIVERSSAGHVLSRIRAGLLERVTTDLMDRLELGGRMHAEGVVEEAFNLADGDRWIHIEFERLTGHRMMVYGQTELTKDLIDAAPGRDLPICWETGDSVAVHEIDGENPYVTFETDGETHRIDARFIAGCDGYHGPSRRAIPKNAVKEYEHAYPFGWLGILSDVPPCNHELIYSSHERGFALATLRSTTRSRYYIDVPLTEKLEDWPDDRLWDELAIRLGPDAAARMTRGPALEKSIAPLRSYIFTPMQHGSLFLCGDAAHIVPPTGAKGLNLAASDVTFLSDALIAWFRKSDREKVAGYGATALKRVWKAERFSWYLTKLMHRFPGDGDFERAMQVSELDYIANSEAMQTAIAENYVGLPL